MAKKSVVFVTQPLVCGGVEKSLLSVLAELPPDRLNVTVWLTEKRGELLPYVPSWVKVEEVPLSQMDRYEINHGRKSALLYAVTHFRWVHVVRMLTARICWWLSGGSWIDYNAKIVAAMVGRIKAEKMSDRFDYAFAYTGNMLCALIVRNLVDAPMKAIWCHDETAIDSANEKSWKDIRASFTHRFATRQLSERINVAIAPARILQFEEMPYFLDFGLACRMADDGDGFTDGYEGLRILTVGRLADQKGIDNAIRLAARLKTDGLKFKWYVVGGGDERERLERQIAESDVGDCFALLGQFINPYPFFKACDIYAQPSRWEAYCITVAEARMFNRPIVCTDFVGAREQLIEGKTGLIVPLGDMDGFYKALKRLLADQRLRESLSAALAHETADSVIAARNAWYRLLGLNEE
ncbi:MAG: glycosyltransferase [Kiritimatiellae bacterium]|nr:glycosyltransferase [Kiritimatiellia bacterium]